MNYCHAVILVESNDLILWIIRLYWNGGTDRVTNSNRPIRPRYRSDVTYFNGIFRGILFVSYRYIPVPDCGLKGTRVTSTDDGHPESLPKGSGSYVLRLRVSEHNKKKILNILVTSFVFNLYLYFYTYVCKQFIADFTLLVE